jgi:hypothetical protein
LHHRIDESDMWVFVDDTCPRPSAVAKPYYGLVIGGIKIGGVLADTHDNLVGIVCYRIREKLFQVNGEPKRRACNRLYGGQRFADFGLYRPLDDSHSNRFPA